jgi:hypothetical protein
MRWTCRNVEVAEWSRDVSSGKEGDKWANGEEKEIATFDSEELDHDDAETETFVCAGLKLHLSGYSVAGDVEWVREGNGNPDLGMMRSSVHRLWPRLSLKSHFVDELKANRRTTD